MRLVQATRLGSVDDYSLVETAMPRLETGQVLVKVAACGMGYVDALVALGGYQVKPALPFTPGQEISGVVVEVAGDVGDLAVGDRVMGNAFGGGLAEFVALPGGSVWKIPDTMTMGQAAGFRINYLTALHGLADRARLQPGERLLVFGAAGGVGAAAVQVGRQLGAHVIAACSTEQKRQFALAAGAQRTIDTESDGWRERLRAVCDGAGPDVVFDPVTGPLFEPAFRSLAWRGRHLVVGFAARESAKLPVNLPLMKGASLVGVDVRQFLLFEPELADRHTGALLDWARDKSIDVPSGPSFAFDQFAAAMNLALSGQSMGKIRVEF
jgi:NADPH2:quinone reductase